MQKNEKIVHFFWVALLNAHKKPLALHKDNCYKPRYEP